MFRTVRPQRSSAQVVEQIRASISEGKLSPGSRLPAERELADQFGVSRTTIREAIQALSSLGILEVKQGLGTFVSTRVTTMEDPAYWVPWLTTHREDLLALLDVRAALETKACDLAARAVSRNQTTAMSALERLALNLHQMETAVSERKVPGLEQLDLEFHALLAEMTENQYLLRLSRSINHALIDRRAVLSIPGRAEQSALQHTAILEAIRAGDPAAAAAAMDRHMESAKATVRMQT